MRKKRKVYKKVLEKLPARASKRGAKVMYKFIAKNRTRSVNGKYYQHKAGSIRI